jgi:hypothetical protein
MTEPERDTDELDDEALNTASGGVVKQPKSDGATTDLTVA